MQLTPYLEQLGLDQKEIAIYTATLELGECPIMPITRAVKFPRSTVYHILEKLGDQGLILITPGSTRRMYTATSPRGLLSLLKKHRKTIDEQISSLDIALPELSELYDVSRFQPKIKFYTGRDEIRDLYDSILDAPINEFFYISEIKKVDTVLGHEWLTNWLDRRISAGIRSKAIWVRDQAILDDSLYRPSRFTLRTVRYAPEDFHTPTHILVFGDNVALITTAEENTGMLISSRDFATSMRNMFKQLWKVSSEK